MKGTALLLLCAIALTLGSQPKRNSDGTKICNCNPSEAQSICSDYSSDGILIAHENCNKFYQCFDGRPIPFACPSTLLYNPELELCDWPQNVECGDRPIIEGDGEDCDENNDNGQTDDNENDNNGTDNNKEEEDCEDNSDATCNCNPSEAPDICKKENSDGVLIANENCNQFYKCFNGIPVPIDCPLNLLYNPKHEICDWPEKVDCGDRVISGGTEDSGNGGNGNGGSDNGGSGTEGGNESVGADNNDPSEAPAICASEGSNGVLVAHENCNKFYICSYGRPVAMMCPGNLLFNSKTDQCDWSDKVDCGDRVIPDGNDNGGSDNGGSENDDSDNGGSDNGGNGDVGAGNCDPSQAPSICAAEGSDGVLVAHENCNQFYKCSEGKPVALICPVTLLFNPITNQCDWPDKVDCGDRVIPEGNDNDGNDNGDSDNGGSDNGGSDNGGSDNGDTGNVGAGNCDPSQAPSICAGEGSDGVLVAHENCNQFYKCSEGKPVALTCPVTLLFNPITDQCDWPDKVDCGDRVIPEGNDNGGSDNGGSDNGGSDNGGSDNGGSDNGGTGNVGAGNCDPSQAPSICAVEGSEGVLVAHENCNQYYICSNGKPVALKCPIPLLFNPNTDQCDWPDKVDCGDRVIPEGNDNGGSDNGESDNGGSDNGGSDNGGTGNVGAGNCDPSQAPSICAVEGSEGVLVAHENCNQYYICSNGKPVALKCPVPLLFNPNTDQCDWPDKVDCGDRVIPEGNDNDGNDNGGSDNGGSDNGGSDNGGSDNGGTGNVGAGNCDPSQAPSICAAEGSEGVLVAHENCNQYYICSNGKPVALKCPVPLLFNPNTDQCDWPDKVDCGDRVIPEGNDNDGNDNGGSDNGGSDNGGSDNGGSDNGGSDNGGTGNVGAGNCDPSQAPSICAAEGSEGVLVAHENCNQYYICSNGKPVALKCPVPLLFNPNTDQCDWPNKVDCGDRVIPDESDNDGNDNGGSDNGGSDNGGSDNGGSDNGGTGNVGAGNCDPSQAPSICAVEGSEGVLVAHENCNKYYICSNGKPVALKCPVPLLFNPNTDQCDWPDKVDCGDRVIPEGNDNDGNDNGGSDNGGSDNGGSDNGGSDNGGTGNVGAGNCDPSQAPSICAAEGSEGVLVAHENCNQYYICSNGKPVALKCPVPLLFNPNTDQCDWPNKVDCGDRVIPDESDNDGNDNGGSDNGGSDNGGSDNGGSDNGGSDNGGSDNGGTGNVGAGNSDPSQAPSICAAEGSEGVLVAHENCNQFYVCSNGKPVALKCPGTLHFNPNTDQCDWPDKVDCGDRVIPDGSDNGGSDNGGSDNGGSDNGGSDTGGTGNVGAGNCDPSQAPSICATEGSEGVLVAHENCNQYYICSNGKPVALKCPVPLLFNPTTDQCDWPDKVDCGDRVIPDGNDNDGNDNGGSDNGGSDNGGSDNGGSDNGGSDNGGSDNGGTGNVGAGNSDPSQAPSICAAEGSEGVLVAHENCNQFYVCSNGKPVALKCPGTLLFNPNTDQCDWPDQVDCGDRVIPDESDNDGNDNGGSDNGGSDNGGSDNGGSDNDGSDNGGTGNVGAGNSDPSQAPSICAAEGSEGVLVAHENCNQFYVCSNGKPVALKCPGTLLFNPNTDECDWPDKVDCGDRVIPEGNDNDGNDNGGSDNGGSDNGGSDNGGSDNGGSDNGDTGNVGAGNCDPSQAPSICAAEGSEGVLVAHENCNQYYICSNGKPVALKCPVPLLFNPNTDQCDWPNKVDCGDRVIPDESDNDGNDNGGSDNGGSDNGGSDNGGTDNGGSDNGGTGNVGAGNCDPSQAPSICAAEGSEGVLVAHENCNQYYICSNGKPVALKCPVPLLFNPNTDQCDWPNKVDCGDRVIPDESDNDGNDNGGSDNGGSDNGGSDNGGSDNDGSDNGGTGNVGAGNCDPSQAPSICAAEGSEGVLVAHENCNQYYICSNGKPVALKCPVPLLFNPNTDQCDWPDKVDCGDRVIPEGNDNDGNDNGGSDNGGSDNGGSDNGGSDNGGSDNGGTDNGGSDNGGTGNVGAGNCDPSQAPSICAAEGSEGVLVAHENCNQYYICSNGKPVALKCPVPLLFNPSTDQCDWPDKVDCDDRVIPEGNDNDGNDNGGSDNGGSDNGGSDNGGSDNGGSDNGGSDTGGTGNVGAGNCDPSQAPSICAAEGSEGVLVAHENCNQYYICSNGKPVALECPVPLLFNPNTDQCDWPDKVDCGDRVIPEGNDYDGNDNGGSDNGGSDNGGSDNGGSDNGGSDNGGAGNVGAGNSDPSQAPSICAAEGSDGVLVAHENCNQFYKCSEGKPVALTCPVTLLFNPSTNQCDWPDKVDCGDRVIPEGSDNDGIDNGGSDNGGSDNGGSDNGGSDNGGSDNGNTGNVGAGNCDPSQAPSICAAEGSEGVLVAHENCNQYYICSNGRPVALKCPVPLLFNPNTDQCDWPDKVDCDDRVIPEGNDNDGNDNGGSDNGGSDNGGSDNGGSDNGGTDNGGSDNGGTGNVGAGNCDPSQAPSICSTEGSDGVLVAHENCNQFYKCSEGKPVALTCPVTLLFNPHTDQCDWPDQVDCGDRVIPEENDNQGSDNGGSDIGGIDNGGSDNGGNDGSDYGGNNNVGAGNCNPSEAPSICAAEGSDGVLVAHENCNKFYKCSESKPVALTCPGTLLFNPYTDLCDWPDQVECGDRVIQEGNDNDGSDNDGSDNGGSDNEGSGSGGAGNSNPSEASSICAAEGADGVLVAHENCNQFYKCSEGKPVALACPGTLLFNPYTDQCDWPDQVECGDRVIQDGNDNDGSDNGGSDSGGSDNGGSDNGGSGNGGAGNSNPSEASSICAENGSNGILVAHENCNQYYVCVDGKPVALSCPENLLFNPDTDTCDWAANVNCGDRVIPEKDAGSGDNGGNDIGGGDNDSDNGGGDSGGSDSGDDADSGNSDPSEAPAICASAGSNGILVAHERCNKFYMCAEGSPVPLVCSANLLFNPSIGVCDWPRNVDCGDRIIPESEDVCLCSARQAPSICSREQSNGLLIAHEYCNQYYICVDGSPVAKSCPLNHLYNPHEAACDWAQNVSCDEREISYSLNKHLDVRQTIRF